LVFLMVLLLEISWDKKALEDFSHLLQGREPLSIFSFLCCGFFSLASPPIPPCDSYPLCPTSACAVRFRVPYVPPPPHPPHHTLIFPVPSFAFILRSSSHILVGHLVSNSGIDYPSLPTPPIFFFSPPPSLTPTLP